MFSWLVALVPVFWLMELDLLSMKGSSVSSSRFWSVYGFSMPLGSPSSFCGVQFSRSVVSDSLRPHESQHTRPPCLSPTPGVHSNSGPSSRWCHPAISSSGVPFSSCPQSHPESEYFPMSQLFAWGGQSIGVSAFVVLLLLLLSHFSRVRHCATPWTAAHQALPFLGFSRQEHWSGLPFASPMHEREKSKWSRITAVPPVPYLSLGSLTVLLFPCPALCCCPKLGR